MGKLGHREHAERKTHTVHDPQNQNELYCQVCLHMQGICFGDRSSTVQQNDKTRRIIKTIIYKIDNVQNSTNTIYKIDSLVCTGMLGANLKFNKYVC